MPPDNRQHTNDPPAPADYGYQAPLSALLQLGERLLSKRIQHDYLVMGIGESHVGDLARMSTDQAISQAPSNSPEVWAPVHAMRALAQIGGESTIAPLVRLIEYDATVDHDVMDDWFLEEVPGALARVGPAAIPRVAQLLRDNSKHTHSRLAAATALSALAEGNDAVREQCIHLLKEQLEHFADNEPEWNGWLISELICAKGHAAAALIERAYAADRVDETIVGDWEEVQAKLGLRPPLSDEEYAEKCKKRVAAQGWLPPEEMLVDDVDLELAEEMLTPWDDSGAQAWERFAKPAATNSADASSAVSNESEMLDGMFMPEDVYTAAERRRVAQQRNKERKAAQRAKLRLKQNKNRR